MSIEKIEGNKRIRRIVPLLFVALFISKKKKEVAILHVLQTLENLLDTVQGAAKQFRIAHDAYKKLLETAPDRAEYNKVYEIYELSYTDMLKSFKEARKCVIQLNQSVPKMKGYTRVKSIKLAKKVKKIVDEQLSYKKIEQI